MSGPRRIDRIGQRVLLHGALIAGAILFSLPFLWLVTTSFKEDDEVFSDPPRWIPMIPTYSLTSPFLDTHCRDPFLPQKDQTALRKRWDKVKYGVEEAIWKSISAQLGGDQWRAQKPNLSMSLQTGLREPLVASVWSDIAQGMPDEIQEAPLQAMQRWIRRRVGPEETENAWQEVVRVFCLGDVTLFDRTESPLPGKVRVEEWVCDDPNIERVQAVTLEGEDGLSLRHSFLQTHRLNVKRLCFVEAGADQVGRIDVSYHSDKSWHMLDLKVSTARGVWNSKWEEPLGENTWQEWSYQFEAPKERDSLIIPLVPLKEETEVTDPAVLQVELSLVRSTRLGAVFRKFYSNYREALRYVPFWVYARNSLYLVVMNVLGQLMACSLVAYAFARLKWYGRDLLFMVLLSTMMIPAEVTMIPYFVVIRELHWYNTLKALWVPAFFGTPFFIFLLRQFYRTIPNDLEDAAKIDGCSLIGIYWRIMLPLMKPALATIAIFQFMGTWNDFMRPLIFINAETLTPLPLGLYVFRTQYSAEYGMMMAASGLMTLPVIATFFMAQRYFIQGVTLTGLKG